MNKTHHRENRKMSATVTYSDEDKNGKKQDGDDSDGKGHYSSPQASNKDKIFSILFYSSSSLAIIFVNKYILSVFDFPFFNFIAFLQFVSTSVTIGYLVFINKLDVPRLTWPIAREVSDLCGHFGLMQSS
jgi:hypothetical protein